MGPWIWIYEYRYKDTKVHGYIQGYGDVWIQGYRQKCMDTRI